LIKEGFSAGSVKYAERRKQGAGLETGAAPFFFFEHE
jgi:hypothetical protein